jgi:hypothetical protein
MFLKILSSPIAKVILSIVWGLGLSALFRRACNGRSCIVYMGPHPSDIQGKVFKHGDKCYKYSMKRANCDPIDDNNVHVDKEVSLANRQKNEHKNENNESSSQ